MKKYCSIENNEIIEAIQYFKKGDHSEVITTSVICNGEFLYVAYIMTNGGPCILFPSDFILKKMNGSYQVMSKKEFIKKYRLLEG